MSGRTMPRQRPGLSEQSVWTPWSLIAAAQNKLHIYAFNWDLAADANNTKVAIDECTERFKMRRRFFNVSDDALRQPWHRLNEYYGFEGQPWNWLNPEFGQIAPWVEKCCEEATLGAHTALLVPASLGANWWADFVHGHAYVLALRSRVKFVGHDQCYPKDLALCLYTPTGYTGMELWDWHEDIGRAVLHPEPAEAESLPIDLDEVPF